MHMILKISCKHPVASPENGYQPIFLLFKNPAHFGLSNLYFSDIFHGSVALETIKLMGHRKNKGMENDVYKPLVLVKFIST